MDSERTVATALADYLRQAGVSHVFGYPGESVVDFMEATRRAGPATVAAVREASAAFMAEGAAMRTGRIGVCLSTLGPGSTALLNGVASATMDRVPVLAISGQVEGSREPYWTHQVVDHNRLFAPVTKLTARLEAASADTVIRKALRTATAERPGAVHLTVATNTFGMTTGSSESEGKVPPLVPAAATLDFYGEDPLRQLRGARRPVLLAGGGAVRCGAGAVLTHLAERAGLPVVVGAMAKGVISEDHPYFAGVLDMAGHRVIWDLLGSADLIVTAGFDPVELITPWQVAAPVLHVDTTPNTDQVYPASVEVVGNVAASLSWLLSAWEGAPRWSEADLAAHRTALSTAYNTGYVKGRLNPSEVVSTVRSSAPAGTVLTVDVGSHKIMTGQAWTAYAPRETLITNGLSAMGFGLPAAVGAALSGAALPGVGGPVVCLTGDGGFAMTATELAVAARYGLGLVVVVFSDGSLNRIELHQASLGYPLTATSVDRVDIPALAESLGCEGARVDSVAGLEKALSAAFAGRGRPLVIEARVDASQYSAQF